ncbi:hypothetical protein HYC85_003137 [Camellia sinensis]|uniref:Rapid ALkalinization Factor n=1 Tax=Camellia sinensis TaxID=4442 RepID=A0A7J7ICJ9_CAMSI|nr:hypothetical protein HYC85_003137 [Camellia sinensis]
MKTKMKIKPYHIDFSFVLLLMILLYFSICRAGSAKKSNSMISGGCNTTIGECLTDEGEGEEEFLMESETTRRFLGSTGYVNPQQKGPICQTTGPYSNCNFLANKYSRPCTTYDHCRRSPGAH